MRTRPMRHAVVHTVTVIAALGIVFGAVTACGSGEQAPAVPPAEGQPGAPAEAQQGADASGSLGTAGQGAAALAALGGLGQDRGETPAVRDLGGQLATDGQALIDQLRAGAGGTLPAEPNAEQQVVLTDLQARTGEQFDQAWLRAAGQMQQQVRDAANAVLADETASEEAKAAARDALSRLDALNAELRRAASAAGAGTPSSVDAGNGGHSAGDVTPLALVLLGLGTALLAGASWWRRRAV